MAEGTVKFFNDDKGYGFIAPEGVKIDPKRGKPNAVDVRVLGRRSLGIPPKVNRPSGSEA